MRLRLEDIKDQRNAICQAALGMAHEDAQIESSVTSNP